MNRLPLVSFAQASILPPSALVQQLLHLSSLAEGLNAVHQDGGFCQSLDGLSEQDLRSVQENLETAKQLRAYLAGCTELSCTGLAEPACLDAQALAVPGSDEVRKPRVSLWAERARDGSLRVYFGLPDADGNDVDVTQQGVQGSDYRVFPFRPNGRMAANLLVRIPKDLFSFKGQSGEFVVQESQKEVVGAILCGLRELALALSEVCEIWVEAWPFYIGGRFHMETRAQRVSLALQPLCIGDDERAKAFRQAFNQLNRPAAAAPAQESAQAA